MHAVFKDYLHPGSASRFWYETVFEHFPRWVFGEFYWSAKYVGNFPRSTHMFISLLHSRF